MMIKTNITKKVVLIIGMIFATTGVVQAKGLGGSSAGYPIQINGQKTIVLDAGDLAQIVKRETRDTPEVLQVAMNVISSCRRLNKCPLTKDTLINMVQAAFDKKTVLVADLVDFDAVLKTPLNFKKAPTENSTLLAGDPLLGN